MHQLQALLGGQLEAELMAFDGALPLVRRSKATRHVSLAQPVGVERLLQAGHGAVIFRWCEAFCRCELIICVPLGILLSERWLHHDAHFRREDLDSPVLARTTRSA